MNYKNCFVNNNENKKTSTTDFCTEIPYLSLERYVNKNEANYFVSLKKKKLWPEILVISSGHIGERCETNRNKMRTS